MSRFNYAKEKAEFDRKWAILEKEYRSAGMPEADIQEMHDYDFGIFKRRRSWATYETPFSELLPDDASDEELNVESPTIGERFLVDDTYQMITADAQLLWINELTHSDLVEKLLQMSARDLSILSAYVFEGKKQKEIAEYYGCSQSDISQKLTRIKKIIKKFYGVL